jgi:hypothetical protein
MGEVVQRLSLRVVVLELIRKLLPPTTVAHPVSELSPAAEIAPRTRMSVPRDFVRADDRVNALGGEDIVLSGGQPRSKAPWGNLLIANKK